ncbi:YrzE family protein [Halorubrum sp. LN27]|uniref:YrzE family protein n=1 Tax=Halorubrum sp. LN27 TaxID=2801032 RepID=UPI00190B66A1|nr:YrzE family protein [Halorubrum sp. LN27]
MSEADTAEFTVSDQLYEVSEATNADGTVSVEIFDYERVSENDLEVNFRTPTMEEKSEIMDWPRIDDPDKYKFVRICEATVGGLNGADWLKTDGAELKANPEDWTLIPESPEEGWITPQKKKKWVWAGYLFFIFLSGFLTLQSIVTFSLLRFILFSLLFIGLIGNMLDKYSKYNFEEWDTQQQDC